MTSVPHANTNTSPNIATADKVGTPEQTEPESIDVAESTNLRVNLSYTAAPQVSRSSSSRLQVPLSPVGQQLPLRARRRLEPSPARQSVVEQTTVNQHRAEEPAAEAERRELAGKAAADIMGLAYNVYLNSNRVYGCKNCKTHLSNHDDIISRNFRGQHGKAYLFDNVVNVLSGEPNERNMTTGRHIVRDISCRQCKETVGWKYDKAYESSEKYKEGKFILEAELLCTV